MLAIEQLGVASGRVEIACQTELPHLFRWVLSVWVGLVWFGLGFSFGLGYPSTRTKPNQTNLIL